MPAAATALTILQFTRIGLELLEKYQRGEISEEELDKRWLAMQSRLGSASDEIRS